MKKLFTVLCVSLIAAFFLFGGDVSDAQANPNYVKWKWVKYKVMVDNRYPMEDIRHCYVRVCIQYTNISNNKIVTTLFKKNTWLNGLWNSEAGVFSASGVSYKANKVELYPGASFTLYYDLQVKKLSARQDNYYRLQDSIKLFIKQNKIIKSQIKHTFNASAKPI